MTHPDTDSQIVHATSVSIDGRAALIRGPSGSGKSGLALQLIALGASLVSDDRTRICRSGDKIILRAPEHLRGLIEARGVGILPAPTTPCARLSMIVDMTQSEDDRLPPWREDTLMGCPIPVVRKSDAAHFPAAVILYLKQGRRD